MYIGLKVIKSSIAFICDYLEYMGLIKHFDNVMHIQNDTFVIKHGFIFNYIYNTVFRIKK